MLDEAGRIAMIADIGGDGYILLEAYISSGSKEVLYTLKEREIRRGKTRKKNKRDAHGTLMKTGAVTQKGTMGRDIYRTAERE